MNRLKINHLTEKNSGFILIFIIITAAILRLYFFTGMIFSDDAYYNQLAISFSNGNYPDGYIGYPIFLLRKLQTFLTSVGFFIIGKNEAGSVLFPFLFSIASIPLVYQTAINLKLGKSVALISAFLLAIFPVDIVFATINFPDLTGSFFLNLGIVFLLLHRVSSKRYFPVLAGFSFSLSIFLKVNFTFIAILLFLLFIFSFIKQKNVEWGILISIGIPIAALFLEALLYYFIYSDFLYRLHIMQENFSYAYYDFFPNNLIVRKSLTDNYTSALIIQWYLNIRSVFLRRFYLFIPAIALAQSFISLRKKENHLLIFWFAGLSVLYLFFTSSFTSYVPLDLTSGWYIYPLFFPAIILSSAFINERKLPVKIILFGALLLFSIRMSFSLHEFFDLRNKNEFSRFLKQRVAAKIYTDHHTSYGINLIDGYPAHPRTNIITGGDFSFDQVKQDAMIIFNPEVIEELELQGHSFPDFSELEKFGFRKTTEFGKFKIYRKIIN